MKYYYSGTFHNCLSEMRTTSIQWTNNVPPIEFSIEITISERPTTSCLWTTDRKCAPKGQVHVPIKLASKSGQRSKLWVEECEISIKISTGSYSAAPRKYISYILHSQTVDSHPFSVSVHAWGHWFSFLQTTSLWIMDTLGDRSLVLCWEVVQISEVLATLNYKAAKLQFSAVKINQ